jgi:hypothetical protein
MNKTTQKATEKAVPIINATCIHRAFFSLRSICIVSIVSVCWLHKIIRENT